MFIGRNQILAQVITVSEEDLINKIAIEINEDLLSQFTVGSLVNINGCALNICALDAQSITVELTKEHIRSSTLGRLKPKSVVGIEHQARLGDQMSNFYLTGEISTQAEITRIFTSENNHQIWMKLQRSDLEKYLFEKTLIGVDGLVASVAECNKNKFCIHLPASQKNNTAIGLKKIRDFANVEFNMHIIVTVDTVIRCVEMMQNSLQKDVTSMIEQQVKSIVQKNHKIP